MEARITDPVWDHEEILVKRGAVSWAVGDNFHSHGSERREIL
jgi:hypothetical protein